jgi:adenine deaminase
LLLFGLDWVTREAVKAGMTPEQAWAMGSLHGATRFGMENEIGGLGGGRRADLVLLTDDLKPVNTWYGGELVVEDRKVTPILEEALSRPYRYPQAAYHTVKLPKNLKLTPNLPTETVIAHTIKTELPGITLGHAKVDARARQRLAERISTATASALSPSSSATANPPAMSRTAC